MNRPENASAATTGYGIASLVIGLIALITSIGSAMGFVLAVIGLVLGCDGLRWVRRGLRVGGEIATAGLILNGLALALSILHLAIDLSN
jgi:hypothetical protein